MKKISKKGIMEISWVQTLVWVLVMCAVVGGFGLLLLTKFGEQAGPGAANESIYDATVAIGSVFSDWYGLIILVGIMAVLIVLLMKAFSGGFGRK